MSTNRYYEISSTAEMAIDQVGMERKLAVLPYWTLKAGPAEWSAKAPDRQWNSAL
jgi:hypothetical protein